MEREILSKYKKQEEKLILSKVIDKIDFCNTRNQIQYTDFLDLSQKQLIDKFLKSQKISNYIFYGGIEDAERTILLIYPNKIRELIDKVDFNKYITVIKIDLPNENRGKYSHRNYLGAIMKLGVKREKIGDIIVNDIGADILVHPEIEKFLLIHLPELTRFSKAKIEKVLLEKIRELKIKNIVKRLSPEVLESINKLGLSVLESYIKNM